MKMKIKEVREIRKNTPLILKGQQISQFKERLKIGYAMKAAANWSYEVYAIMQNGYIIPVVVVFGEII